MSLVQRTFAIAVVLISSCGGPRSTAGAGDPVPPGSGSSATTAAPPPASCPAGQVTIESCVVGGMPNEDGTANVSCGTSCSPTPPAGSAGQRCEQVSADHYRCTAYAP